MKKSEYYEFKVLTNVTDIVEKPEYYYFTEEEKDAFKEAGCKAIPIKAPTGNTVQEEVVINKNATYKKWMPDISNISIQQTFSKNGKIKKNKFLVQTPTEMFLVEGSYEDFKKKLEIINNIKNSEIGY